MTGNHTDSDRELWQLIITIGRWFDGFGKFAMLMNRCHDERMCGENNMIQRLVQESQKIDNYLKLCLDRYRREAIRNLQERLLDTGKVGEALCCTPDDFWQGYLSDKEREILSDGCTKEKAFSLCLREPIEELFQSPHRLGWFSYDIGARLLEAAVNDGTVTVRIGDSETPVVMDGRTPRMVDALCLAELLDTGVECEVLVGGTGIDFH